MEYLANQLMWLVKDVYVEEDFIVQLDSRSIRVTAHILDLVMCFEAAISIWDAPFSLDWWWPNPSEGPSFIAIRPPGLYELTYQIATNPLLIKV
jgi:hypothetical protein